MYQFILVLCIGVVGIYGVFVSETLVRMPKVVIASGIPNSVFYNMTGIGTALVMAFGVYFFIKLKPKWDRQFGLKNKGNDTTQKITHR